MFSINLAIFFSLLVSAASRPSEAPGLGYLFVNGSQTPFCYDLTPNEICPPNLVNYKILGFDRSTEQVAKMELQAVKFSLQGLEFFQVSQACRDSIREYSCSNMFAVCTLDSKHDINLRYNYEKTKAACARIQSSCPKIVTESVVFNCSLIQKDVSGYIHCAKLPEVLGDVCPKSSYTYPEAMGVFYKATAKTFPETLALLVKLKLFTSPTCEKEFVDINCQMMRGSICSTDMSLRLYAISQQDCAATYTKCISGEVPEVQNYFLESCKLFPDAKTAKRVPLPSVAISNGLYN